MNENESEKTMSSRLPSDERSRVVCVEFLKKQCLNIFNEADQLFNLFTSHDPHLRNTDTVRGVVIILEKFRDLCQQFVLVRPKEREEIFNFIYNCTIFVHQFCICLRKVGVTSRSTRTRRSSTC